MGRSVQEDARERKDFYGRFIQIIVNRTEMKITKEKLEEYIKRLQRYISNRNALLPYIDGWINRTEGYVRNLAITALEVFKMKTAEAKATLEFFEKIKEENFETNEFYIGSDKEDYINSVKRENVILEEALDRKF